MPWPQRALVSKGERESVCVLFVYVFPLLFHNHASHCDSFTELDSKLRLEELSEAKERRLLGNMRVQKEHEAAQRVVQRERAKAQAQQQYMAAMREEQKVRGSILELRWGWMDG